MKIVDLHCDTISFLKDTGGSLLHNQGQYDLERAQTAGMYLQFFAMFTRPAEPNIALRQIIMQVETFHRQMEEHSQLIYNLKSYQDLYEPDRQNKLAAVLHLEGAECLGNDLEVLNYLYRAGLRSIGLTWNYRNQFADGVSEGEAGGGLSKIGRKLVSEMERSGILLDLSHISIKSFYDALSYYNKPVLVSHSNAYSRCKSRRNLNDDQLRALKEHGGVAGITQVADFVHEDNPGIETMLDHMVYIAELIGVEYLALGSDFDGADNMVIKDVSGYCFLPEIMQKRGFTGQEIEMILHQNALSVLEQVLI